MKGHLVVRSVCCPAQGVDLARERRLWDPVPVHPKPPAHCTPDGTLRLGLMLLCPAAAAEAGSAWASSWEASLRPACLSCTLQSPKLQASCSSLRAYVKLWLRAETLFTYRLTTSLQAKPARMHPSSTCPGTTEPRPRPSLDGIGRPGSPVVPPPPHCHASPVVLSTECNLLGLPLLLFFP